MNMSYFYDISLPYTLDVRNLTSLQKIGLFSFDCEETILLNPSIKHFNLDNQFTLKRDRLNYMNFTDYKSLESIWIAGVKSLKEIHMDGLENLDYVFIHNSGSVEDCSYSRGIEKSLTQNSSSTHNREKYIRLEAVR